MVMPVTDHLVICLTELVRAGQARSLHMTTLSCHWCTEPPAITTPYARSVQLASCLTSLV